MVPSVDVLPSVLPVRQRLIMRRTTLAVSLLGAVVVSGTGLSLIRSRAWWVRMHDFPRAQIAGVSAGLLALSLLRNLRARRVRPWERWLPPLLTLALAVQVRRILPYTPLWKTEVPRARPQIDRSRRVRIVISNVCRDNRQFERWRSVVRAEHPDLIVAVEVDRTWDAQLEVLCREYPHCVRLPQPNTYGLALFSRWPLRTTKVRHLVEDDVPSLFASLDLPCGEPVRFVVLHPRPPRPDIGQDSVFRDAELVRAGRVVRRFRTPVIIVGDLNDVAWSRTTDLFQQIAHVRDPRVGRGIFPTYHADHWFLRYPLDHVFHSRQFDLVELRRLPHVGSDHFPILIELALREDQRPRLDPERNDVAEEEAIDAIEDVREQLGGETAAERRERRLMDR